MKRFILAAVVIALLHAPAPAAGNGDLITSMLSLPVPSRLELCGEKVPLGREDAAERLELELIVALSNPVSATLWFKRGNRFFPLIDERIRRSGLPRDLRYVAVIESNLRAEAVSSARAVGPWQFIRSTGKMYGLGNSSWKDDRRNWEKATDAALKHLSDLHTELGSWPLALAAYNAGKRRVTTAMESQGESDFYGLQLPRETERYVFRVMAAKLLLERPEDFGIDLDGARLYPPEETVDMPIQVTRSRLPLSAVAAASGISYRRLKALNAWITGDALPKGSHRLKIPAAAGETFKGALARWEEENREPEIVYYNVRRGDTLSGIAKKHGVDLNKLLAWNSLRERSVIHPGQKLAVRRTN